MSLGTGSPLVNEKEAGGFLAKGDKGPPNSVMRGTPLFRNFYLLYSDSLYVRTHLFCIGQNFPFLYFYIVIGYVNQTKHRVITPIVQTQLSELLCEFEDVFAKSEFD
jgi:hypothetical protein